METKKKLNLVVLSGAGVSAESGIATFRGSGGLWEGYKIEEVASPEAWQRDKQMVLDFYNARRQNIASVKPNNAHIQIAALEKHFFVNVITQNIDNLHEQAGSSNVMHLHGEITKACSSNNKDHIQEIGFRDIEIGETCIDGFQLRPFIVWFGEDVPLIVDASKLVRRADVVLVIGTSLEVYPAAGLVAYAQAGTPIYVIDPHLDPHKIRQWSNTNLIKEKASTGIEVFKNEIKKKANIL
ncbi:MAG: NAD-dependent deacylase [Bacteroidia bacterium]|nr:NAD-dependent deacylase [Bacteroidia bacterium]